MAEKELLPPLISCAHYLVKENRNSDLSVQERLKIQRRTFYGKVLGFLYPLGWFGGQIFLFISLYKRDSVKLYRQMIVADHSSRVIHGALKRVWGVEYDKEVKKTRASLTGTYRSFFSLSQNLKDAYRAADVSHVTEYVRIIRLFHFYIIWQAWFGNHTIQSALIARTNDQNRLALGVVCEERVVPLALFTIARVARPRIVPFAVAEAFCWSSGQTGVYNEAGISTLRMPVPQIMEMKIPVSPEDSRIGMLLNAKVDVDKLKVWIDSAMEKGLTNFQLRPHPGYDTDKLSVLSNVYVCDWYQPLAEYLDSLDLVFALNTHAVIEALLHGVPVVYVGGLDPYEFDLHRFVQSGIVVPWSESLQIPEHVNAFYSSPGFTAQWNTKEFETDPAPERDALLKLSGS